MKKLNKGKKIIILSIVLLLIVVGVTIIRVKYINKEPTNPGPNPSQNGQEGSNNSELKVTGKLLEFIKGLENNYYIKYSGKFKNSLGQKQTAFVEYTKNGQDYALIANDLDIQLVCEGNTLYSISHIYKMIVKMNERHFDISEYNLISDIGQTYVKSYKEKIKKIEYDVEEYDFNGKAIKYYFIGNDIKLIKYDTDDISVVRVEKKTNKQLFVKPKGYTNV